MGLCIKHQKDITKVTLPRDECDQCIENAFNPKLCMICREKEGYEIANGLKVCSVCEIKYW